LDSPALPPRLPGEALSSCKSLLFPLFPVVHKGNLNAGECDGESPQLNRWEGLGASEIQQQSQKIHPKLLHLDLNKD